MTDERGVLEKSFCIDTPLNRTRGIGQLEANLNTIWWFLCNVIQLKMKIKYREIFPIGSYGIISYDLKFIVNHRM